MIKDLKDNGLVEYALKLESIDLTEKTKLKVFTKKRKALKKEFSFLGYSSFRYFLYAIGLPLFALIVSILLMIIILNPKTIITYKKVYFVAAFSFIYVSSFWVLRSFLTRTDFPQWSYSISYIISAFVTSLIVFYSIKILSKIEKKKKQTQIDLQQMVFNGNELFELIKTT
ncbi:hypothetical protein [Tenacibaculum sp. 190524A02b]|uniref:hypothetical protein n=1 Tax=Tenacibaculum vairaonense TaxID=3137860 RepID=UPI0032B1CD41